MFEGFTEKTIDFLWSIRFNNERSWFRAHREEYGNLLERPMRELAREVYSAVNEAHADLELELHISRIYRDARRLHGRGPYKDHLWFSLRRQSELWTDKPVFWFEIAPEAWSYGMGYYSARALTMAKLRARIDKSPAALKELAERLDGQAEFILEGNEYSRPKCNPEMPLAEWYNKKNFSIIHEEEVGKALFAHDLARRLISGFEFLIPFYRYFIMLDGDPDPRPQ
ncbi:MAG: DUF2461 domain-containing protein [Oscillospiraceae bacterium]|jgi:uncharacterized protein (TIGR02453 family)